ncbi:PREDICTED: UDP-glycosyltransferase 71K1-like [Nelumbo nucifera]|uniref:Glycosyltransferase n=2 Tax=Nelumbo nucifera TaxID=4432 RepID=A0A1U8A3G6_NELNU|nr:PREDICTED: UDP-glycosyltransferase 71K1-like [Nelumbo nucifera]DAD44046.1 TPA_asm: hypothetical protein HUJ06_002276 [Nelumbo nucifera]
MEKEELVFVPSPGAGHLVSTIELAKRLIDRHDRLSITVLCIKPPSILNAGYIDSLASSAPWIRWIELPSVDPPSPETCKLPFSFISRFIEGHRPHVKQAVTQLMASQRQSRIAGLVLDLFCSPLIDVAAELGIPSYMFFTSPAAMLGLMLHFPTLNSQTTTDLKDSVELIIPSYVNPVSPRFLPVSLWIRKEDAYIRWLYHCRPFREAKGIIVNSFSELESHAINSFSDGRTPPVYPVGPLIDLESRIHSPSNRIRRDKIVKWLDDQPPSSVVLLCFGSMGGFGAPQVKEIAVGLERSDVRFLWSLRQPSEVMMGPPRDYTSVELGEILPNGFLDRTEGRGLICGWIPQVEVLGHPAIGGFISHCGWNSILESLWFGVPVATWPLYAEQHLNAFEMVRDLGLALEIRLDYRNGDDLVSAEEVERSVRSLMDGDSEVRRRVWDMREKSRATVVDGGSSFSSLGFLIDDLMAKN